MAPRPDELSSVTVSANIHGDLLRNHVGRCTELGLQAKAIMARGELVPDELMYGIVACRLREADCRPDFVLDGSTDRRPGRYGWTLSWKRGL